MNAKNEKNHVEIIQMASSRPLSLENVILWRSEFKKTKQNKKICMEKVVGEQDLALQHHFHTNPLNFPKIQNCRINLLFNDRSLKLGHFGIFFIYGILSTITHNIKSDPSCKGLLANKAREFLQ